MRHVNILGIETAPLTMDQSLARCLVLMSERGHQHVVVNAAKAVLADEQPEFKNLLNACSIVNADGQSIVWASRILGRPLPERVAGIDLMMRLVSESATRNFSIYLLGARQNVVSRVSQTLREQGANIVGFRDGYWAPHESERVIKEISELAPDLLLVAIPSPQKEYFLAENLKALNVGLAFGVGGSFDVVAGVTKRAPAFLQKVGMEWAFRLFQEPRRMFKRYLVGNLKFTRLLFAYKFGKTRRGA